MDNFLEYIFNRKREYIKREIEKAKRNHDVAAMSYMQGALEGMNSAISLFEGKEIDREGNWLTKEESDINRAEDKDKIPDNLLDGV